MTPIFSMNNPKYRIRRLGKTNPCNYYYLLVKGSVERDRYRSVKKQKEF